MWKIYNFSTFSVSFYFKITNIFHLNYTVSYCKDRGKISCALKEIKCAHQNVLLALLKLFFNTDLIFCTMQKYIAAGA